MTMPYIRGKQRLRQKRPQYTEPKAYGRRSYRDDCGAWVRGRGARSFAGTIEAHGWLQRGSRLFGPLGSGLQKKSPALSHRASLVLASRFLVLKLVAAAGSSLAAAFGGLEGGAAGAGLDGVGVVDGEAGLHQVVYVVDLGALE